MVLEFDRYQASIARVQMKLQGTEVGVFLVRVALLQKTRGAGFGQLYYLARSLGQR